MFVSVFHVFCTCVYPQTSCSDFPRTDKLICASTWVLNSREEIAAMQRWHPLVALSSLAFLRSCRHHVTSSSELHRSKPTLVNSFCSCCGVLVRPDVAAEWYNYHSIYLFFLLNRGKSLIASRFADNINPRTQHVWCLKGSARYVAAGDRYGTLRFWLLTVVPYACTPWSLVCVAWCTFTMSTVRGMYPMWDWGAYSNYSFLYLPVLCTVYHMYQ